MCCSLTDYAVAAIAEALPRLRELNIGNNRNDGEGLNRISPASVKLLAGSLTNLTRLELRSCCPDLDTTRIGDEGAYEMGRGVWRLQHIRISHYDVMQVNAA